MSINCVFIGSILTACHSTVSIKPSPEPTQICWKKLQCNSNQMHKCIFKYFFAKSWPFCSGLVEMCKNSTSWLSVIPGEQWHDCDISWELFPYNCECLSRVSVNGCSILLTLSGLNHLGHISPMVSTMLTNVLATQGTRASAAIVLT